MARTLGVNQWFHYLDHEQVERAAETLRDLGARHLRTGISWADFHRPRGKEWYDWQMRTLAEFDVLLSIWHTPPSIAEGGTCASPPRRLADFADFIEQVIDEYGDSFTHLELWNEPNNRFKWNFHEYDPSWRKFARMTGLAAERAKERGVPTVLGGMIPVDGQWLENFRRRAGLDNLDVVAIHGFPEMWWDHAPNWDWYRTWRGWTEKVESIQPYCEGRPVWVTETGLATWDLVRHEESRLDLQIAKLEEAAAAPTERVYWYSLIDLDPSRAAIEGFHVDENEYHLGLVRWDGSRKPSYHRMKELLAERERKVPAADARSGAGARREHPERAAATTSRAAPDRRSPERAGRGTHHDASRA